MDRSTWRSRWPYAVAIAFLVVFVVAHSLAVERRLSFLSEIPMGPATTSAIDRGETLPRLPQVRALDSFLWIDHAKGLAEDGNWRLRHTDFDNAPVGRPVRWHSGLALWIAGLGRIWSGVGDMSMNEGIERAAVWVCPLLFLGAVLGFSLLTYRRWGSLAASALAIAMLASGDFYGGFLPGEPDHHGLAAACALGTVLGILMAGAGWQSGSPRDVGAARAGMVVSAVSGSVGLWISAVSQSLVFASVGVGFLLCLFGGQAFRTTKSAERSTASADSGIHRPSGAASPGVFTPDLWRFWGRLGAGLSLLFYAIEYVPDALSWHLETNHPVYAVAWLFGGELMAMTGSVAQARRRPEPAEWTRLVISALSVALPALLVVLGGAQSHALRDPFLRQLHGMIVEFMPFVTAARQYSGGTLEAIGLTPVVVVAGIVLVLRGDLGVAARRPLMLALGALAVATAARFYQTRWGSVWGGVVIAMTPLVAVYVSAWLRERLGLGRASLIGLVVIGAAMAISPWRIYASDRESANQTEELTLDELHALVLREVAYRLRETHSGRPTVVLTGPDTTVRLIAFARSLPSLRRASGIGTLYWENVEGLRAAAEMSTAREDSEARRLLDQHNVTHILLVEWEDFTEGYYELLHPDLDVDAGIAATFGRRLGNPSTRPSWLREVPVEQIEQAREMGLRVVLLAVAP